MDPIEFKLTIYFIGDKTNTPFSGYKIFEKIYDFDTNEIKFSKGINDSFKDKKMIDFQLILKKEAIEELPPVFHFFLYKGINIVYCFIMDDLTNLLFDYCFLDKNATVSYKNIVLKEFNYLENDSRSRIKLINSPPKIKINNIFHSLPAYVPQKLIKFSSFQIASFDASFENYSIKEISNEEISDEISIVNIINKNKDNLIKFFNEFESLIKKNETEMKI